MATTYFPLELIGPGAPGFRLLRIESDGSVWCAKVPLIDGQGSDWVKLNPFPGGLFGSVVAVSQSHTLPWIFIFIEEPLAGAHRMIGQVVSPEVSPGMIQWVGWQSMGRPQVV
jgi:hypothetical protein